MFENFSHFTISNWIELFSISTSILLSLTSITIAVLALRQNNKMLEETTRPYVSTSYEVLDNGNTPPSIFLVLKNHGATGAHITSFQCNPNSSKDHSKERFAKINGMFIAPGQKFLYEISPDEFPSDLLDIVIKYRSNFREYIEHQSLKIRIGIQTRRKNRGDIVSCSLQEITERLI